MHNSLKASVFDAMEAAIGSRKITPTNGAIEFLEKNGTYLYAGKEDLVLSTIYKAPMATAKLVIPGEESLKTIPKADQYGIHFVKDFHKRPNGELYHKTDGNDEFERTHEVRACLSPETMEYVVPLDGRVDQYRGRVIPGTSLRQFSPFHTYVGERCKFAHTFKPDQSNQAFIAASNFHDYLDKAHSQLDQLHQNCLVHQDAHLDNFMVIPKTGEVQLIDFQYTEFQKSISEETTIQEKASLLQQSAMTQKFFLGKNYSPLGSLTRGREHWLDETYFKGPLVNSIPDMAPLFENIELNPELDYAL